MRSAECSLLDCDKMISIRSSELGRSNALGSRNLGVAIFKLATRNSESAELTAGFTMCQCDRNLGVTELGVT